MAYMHSSAFFILGVLFKSFAIHLLNRLYLKKKHFTLPFLILYFEQVKNTIQGYQEDYRGISLRSGKRQFTTSTIKSNVFQKMRDTQEL